jgi:hypothetical protein
LKAKLLLATLCLCALSATALAQADASPRFQDYRAPVYKGRVARVDVNGSAQARGYRTRLREGARRGVNFAGHYTLHTWSCGTGCLQTAFIDARTGAATFPAPLNGFIACYWDAKPVESLEEALQFRRDSRLLVMSGYPSGERGKDDPEAGLYYYEWAGGELKLVKFVERERDGACQ